mmetsp:Transcript_13388/g.30921  ORF Transcript_13388/g.30921 Transcript_13388/m.30921 type:complete len:443 (+) Transcript_13388:168-1496(+)
MGIDLRTRSSDGWSEEEEWLLSNIPHVTGALSILGSAFIVYDVASDRNKWSSTYHRLLFGMGILDFVSSFATSLSTLPMPGESGKYSFGNPAICTVQGFFVHFNIASPLYNLSLSIYFFLTIASKWTKGDIKKVEIWLHFLPFLWAFVTALVVLTLEGFNSSKFWCWISSDLTECGDDTNVGCGRCRHCTNYYRWLFFFGPLAIAFVGITVAMSALVYSVRKTEKNAAKWRPSFISDRIKREGRRTPKTKVSTDSRKLSSNASHSAQESESTIRASSSRCEGRRSLRLASTQNGKKASRMTRAVTRQALRYCLAFYLTWIPATISRALEFREDHHYHHYFWVELCHVIFVPMQGLLNCIVYTEPRLKQWRKDRKDARSRSRMVAERSERQNREHSDDSIPVERASGDDDSDSEDDDDFDVDEYLRSVDNQLQQQQAVTTDSM